MLSHVQLFATPGNGACQALLSMGFSKQEYWSGLLFPSPGDLLNPRKNPGLLHCRQTLPSEPPGKAPVKSSLKKVISSQGLLESGVCKFSLPCHSPFSLLWTLDVPLKAWTRVPWPRESFLSGLRVTEG